MKFNEALRRLFDRLVSDLIRNTRSRIENPQSAASATFAGDPSASPRSALPWKQNAEGSRNSSIRTSTSARRLEPEKDAAERVVTELFELWMASPESLPPSYQEKAEQEPLARVVCDYLAGMTDNYDPRAVRETRWRKSVDGNSGGSGAPVRTT